uniref:Uncharacterized protein n=1 Tax=Ciona savignyi TaxID=51511 RepID=H2YAU0_CIOSA
MQWTKPPTYSTNRRGVITIQFSLSTVLCTRKLSNRLTPTISTIFATPVKSHNRGSLKPPCGHPTNLSPNCLQVTVASPGYYTAAQHTLSSTLFCSRHYTITVLSRKPLAMALHLVEAALSLKHKVTPETHGPSSPDMKRSKVEESWYKLFHSWFESEDMLVNIMKTIDFVQAPTFSSDVVAME